MLEGRFLEQYLFANRPQVLDRHAAEVGGVCGQPFAQYVLRAVDHRSGVPQGIVEVEGDQLNRHCEESLLRLARGWALS